MARHRGTEISNPFPSSGESTNFRVPLKTTPVVRAHDLQRGVCKLSARSAPPSIRFPSLTGAFALSRLGTELAELPTTSGYRYSSYCSYHREDAKGDQRPILNLSVRTPDGSIRHGYATELMFPPRDLGQDPGNVDAVWPMGARSISRPRAAARARIRS